MHKVRDRAVVEIKPEAHSIIRHCRFIERDFHQREAELVVLEIEVAKRCQGSGWRLIKVVVVVHVRRSRDLRLPEKVQETLVGARGSLSGTARGGGSRLRG